MAPAIASATIIAHLRTLASPRDAEGQRRFGITPRSEQLGVRIPHLRKLAKEHRRQHALALELFNSDIHDARLLAAFIADPKQVTPALMDEWAGSFDSWDLCDQVCSNVFDRTPWAVEKARTWSGADGEFLKRAGFVLMAAMAVHRKDLDDDVFLAFLPIIEREATDERNFVKKAVNWALRQIGKRNAVLNKAALTYCRRIATIPTPTARWVARDAFRELEKLPDYCLKRFAKT